MKESLIGLKWLSKKCKTNMEYSQKTQDLIDRQRRNVERADFVLDKELSEELILKTYDLFNLPRPKNIRWCIDLEDKNYKRSARSAWSASSASLARSARSARSAWSALDYNFDWYIFEYDYCQNPKKDKMPNESDYKYLEYCELLMQAKEAGLGYMIEWEDTLYLVSTPLVKINGLNQFHSDNSPAIKWKEGQEIFYLNGVLFPQELWKEVTSGKMPFEKIMAINDIDQRTQAMRYGDVNKFLEHTKSILLDESKRGNKLYKIPKEANVFTADTYYLVYSCPSTGKVYMSGVPKELGETKNSDNCQAWKHWLSLEAYKILTIEA